MKKIILTLIFFVALYSFAFAAGSQTVVTSDEIVYSYSTGRVVTQRVITIAFTADDTDGSIPSLTLDSDTWTDGTNSGALSKPIEGWFGYMVEIDCNHAGTEPTENSELYIYQNSLDMLGGNGVDQVDNTAEREVLFYFASTAVTRPVYDSMVVTISQQAAATNSATGSIRLVLTP